MSLTARLHSTSSNRQIMVCVCQDDVELHTCAGTTNTIIHETIHCLGFYHTQARADWADFIKLIDSTERNNLTEKGADPVPGVPYEYGSVMHYPPTGIIWGETFVPMDVEYKRTMGQGSRPTFY
ncbi:hypothetical protein PFISCL1PPCAC_3202, partial [Pristionchus fissidentatus]